MRCPPLPRSPLLAVLSGCLLLGSPALAQSTAKPAAPCLTQGEFTALSTYALPNVIDGASRRCAQSLPESAFLRKQGTALSARYAEKKDAAWPQAKKALFKLSASRGDPTGAMLRQLPDSSLRPIADVMVEGLVSQEIPLNDCTTVDRFVELLAPLPAANMAGLLTLLAGVGTREGKEGPGGLKLCTT